MRCHEIPPKTISEKLLFEAIISSDDLAINNILMRIICEVLFGLFMIQKTKIVYYCQHCNKNGLVKWMMEKHERFCSSNPSNFSKCSNCTHVIEEKIDIEYSGCNNYGDSENYTRTSNSFKCSAKNCGLIPLIARRKGLPEIYPDTFENSIPMPPECDDFKEKDFFNT